MIGALAFLGANGAKMPQPLWQVRLNGEGGILSFERPASRIWLAQEGVAFVSARRLVIYQVNHTAERAPLSARMASGGAGNFVLVLRFIEAETGREIKRMDFVTSATEFSGVLPTHDGKFIVRVGDIVGLFSPDFDLLLSRRLPLEKHAQTDNWEVGVTPSGREVAFVHQERFVDPSAATGGSQNPTAGSKADVEIADADTFKTITQMHLPFYLPAWSLDEHFLLSTQPNRPLEDTEFGTLDFEGHWSGLRPSWAEKHPCQYAMDLLPHDLMAGYGCGLLVVFPESSEPLLRISESSEAFASVAGADHYLAIETVDATPGLYGLSKFPFLEPSQIMVYDLNSRRRILAVKIKSSVVKYAISSDGVLAVVDGDVLRVYRPEL